jgi:hypothetical protein
MFLKIVKPGAINEGKIYELANSSSDTYGLKRYGEVIVVDQTKRNNRQYLGIYHSGQAVRFDPYFYKAL